MIHKGGISNVNSSEEIEPNISFAKVVPSSHLELEADLDVLVSDKSTSHVMVDVIQSLL
jgi:hypothetical protein